MSGGLDELYQQTLERIEKQAGDDGRLGMRILSWITHARRPLSVNELRHGLAVEYSDDGEGLEKFDGENLLSPGSLVDVCAGLVLIDSTSQIVRLVHYTTQEYFDKARLQLFKGAEVDISRACLTYLSYDFDRKLRDTVSIKMDIIYEALRSHPFLDYASHYWFSHVKSGLLVEFKNPVLLKVVARFKSSDNILISARIRRMLNSGLFPQFHLILGDIDLSALEIACELGLEELVTVLLDPSTVTCPISDRSLLFASDAGNLDILKLLLGYGARVNSTAKKLFGATITALGLACRKGHLSVAEFLIESGADIEGNGLVVVPPIHNATVAASGCAHIVDLLLKKGVNVNARDFFGRTACHMAAYHSSADSVRRLLDAGCDPELMDDGGRTALHYAADVSDYNMIKLLLDRGADASVKDGEGTTARNLFERRLEVLGVDNTGIGEQKRRLIERLRQLEQESSTPATNDPKESEANSSNE